jgi:hypothetical protein
MSGIGFVTSLHYPADTLTPNPFRLELETALYVLLRNPAVMAQPLSARRARDIATAYFRIPNVMRLENAPVMDRVWAMAEAEDFPRRKVFDARLRLTLLLGGVTHFATANESDCKDIGFQRVWNPLIA